ncbi:MAG: DUF3575 domain-containing protein, partial [Bacteroidota bacterium]
MKILRHSFLTLCLLTGLFATRAQAQIDVTINPVGLLFGDFNVGADFAISEKFSTEATIGANFGSSNLSLDDTEFKYRGIPITVFGKYYFNPRTAADKFYADAWVRFVSRSYTVEDSGSNISDYSQTRLGIGFGIGYKVVSDGGFVFDIGFGAGRALSDNTTFSGDGDQVTVDWFRLMLAG